MQIAFLQTITVDFALANPSELSQIGLDIAGMGDVPESLGANLIAGIAGDFADAPVYQETGAVGRDMGNPNRGVFEGRAEPGLAAPELLLGMPPLRDVAYYPLKASIGEPAAKDLSNKNRSILAPESPFAENGLSPGEPG